MMEISRLAKYPLLIDSLLKHTQRKFVNTYLLSVLLCFWSIVDKGSIVVELLLF